MFYVNKTTAIDVQVFHNIAVDEMGRPTGMADGFKPGDPLLHVASWLTTVTADDDQVLRTVWHIFNVGDDEEFGPTYAVALEYRLRGNRSLSKGDVVRIGLEHYSVDGNGFTRRSIADINYDTNSLSQPGSVRIGAVVTH